MEQLIKFAKLLSLRDELCPDSRGHQVTKYKENWAIHYIYDLKKWVPECFIATEKIVVTFKVKEDAQKICDILNEGRFEF